MAPSFREPLSQKIYTKKKTNAKFSHPRRGDPNNQKRNNVKKNVRLAQLKNKFQVRRPPAFSIILSRSNLFSNSRPSPSPLLHRKQKKSDLLRNYRNNRLCCGWHNSVLLGLPIMDALWRANIKL